jgi:glucose-1-phosphate cytidylyltransferase
MVPVGPHPIVWHIMKGYAAHGVRRFILCLGYMRESFINYFMNYHARATDVTIRLGDQGNVTYHKGHGEEDWEVTLVDTGDRTMTGGRIARASCYLQPQDKEFFLTYGDAVSDIDISALLARHRSAAKVLTVTAVHPSGRFGEMGMDADGNVTGFHEKPQTEQGSINGGFMVADRSLTERYLTTSDHLVFEQDPMKSILKDGQMVAYQHEGFWQCMDTAREHGLLNELWDKGNAPWTRGW